MSNENPLDEVKRSHRDADRALDKAAKEVSFSEVVDDVTKRQVQLAKVGAELARVRARGWAWGPELEATRDDLKGRADTVVRDIRQETSQASGTFRHRVDAVRRRLSATAITAGHAAEMKAVEQEAEALEKAIRAEEERLRALAKPFVEPFDALEREIKGAHEHLDRFDSAKFKLNPGESPWLTAECAWQDAPGGPVNGFLYLTDKRLRFEQKETVTTKKFLFFTASSEEKHACLIDEPVGNIARSDDSTKGLIFKDQIVTLTWQNTRLRVTTFDLNSGGTSKEWDARIEDLRNGQIEHRRAQGAAAVSPGATMPVDAPTKCNACGAGLEAPVRGQTTLVCAYCGERHDLRF